ITVDTKLGMLQVKTSTGDYTYTLETNSLAHNTQGTNIDGVHESFDYTVKNSLGNSATSTLTVNIQDDMPVAAPETSSTSAANSINTNLMLVPDPSGSMTSDSGLEGLNRLQACVAAARELIEQYDALGDVKVQIVTFSSSALIQDQGNSNGVWLSLSDAKS